MLCFTIYTRVIPKLNIKMPSKYCVVKGCNSRNDPKHRFPKNAIEDFKIWVHRTGNSSLLSMSNDQIYKSYLMCEQHFEKSCKSPGTNRLKCRSLPTLKLPSTQKIKQKYSVLHVHVYMIIFF